MDILESKVGQKFACMQAQNCTYQLLAKMYDIFQHGLIESGNAELLETPVHMNSSGDVVEDIVDAYGLPVTMKYIRPYNIIVIDETGSSTREMGDRNKSGQRFMAPISKTPRHEASSKHSHFMVVPFTQLSGELVMVAIIFSGEKLKAEWVLGKDIFADWIGEDNEIEKNVGPGKYFPMGPTCDVDGKKIPCYCDCSTNGSITGKILTCILMKLEELGVVEQGMDKNENPFYPALMIDGHISRLSLPFLEYINKQAHR